MHLTRCLLGAVLLMVTHPAVTAAEDPPQFRASYHLYSSGLQIAHMERNLSRNGAGEYLYSSDTRTVGLVAALYKDHIVEESRWTLQAGEVRPLAYHYQRNRSKKKRTINIHFDWDKNEIVNMVNDRQLLMPLKPGILDKLVYQYALMRDVPKNAPEIIYDVTDGGKMKKYNFSRAGREVLSTPLGKLETVKLQKVKHDDQSRLVIWVAEALHYLPVQVESTDEEGRTTTAIIQTLDWYE